ncbi:MAG: DEAD/DEAH box helicase family protein [Paludibacteraceae bacterium]|nr:DEAD/DEAH box helicase family protein [Paludibacteraceae bacterium]
MTPEEKARVKIDRMFEEAGWQVVDRDQYTPISNAIVVREGLLAGNLEADYFIFLDGKAVGVLEAKREEVNIDTLVVSEQAELYVRSVPNYYKTYSNPLPFIYKSNGKELRFRNMQEKTRTYYSIKTIHTPKELARILNIKNDFAGLPMLERKGLRDCQYEAITNIEQSFRSGEKKALVVLATGAGKTYTACLESYRMLAYTPIKRILFLVDRNNLGKQAEGEFGMFRLTENGDSFNTIFAVNRLKSAIIPPESNVVISTIQRLFSVINGEEVSDDDDDELEVENETAHIVEMPDNPAISKDYFDVVIVDECHRSIYGNWKKVLDYFSSARFIGLTATPVAETIAFFNNNMVVNYTLERSIVDGVNVDCRVFRIKTEVTENGGAILKGSKTMVETRYTGTFETMRQKETVNYTGEELNRSVINPSQIKLVLETYKDNVYTQMFTDPQREPKFEYLPKTLIFALNEQHANNIVRIAKEVFGHTAEDDPYVQKITYSSGDSNELIRQFRNNREFRIAVTCTLVATGTDVKPLEVVMFMRDVQSEPLYVQMKGRGVRTIGDEQLRIVTPNAFSKDCYFLVDAVGVTEHDKSIPKPGGGEGSIPFYILLERIAHGNVDDQHLRLLAANLARIDHKCTQEQREKFHTLAGIEMKRISSNIFEALEKYSLPIYEDINMSNQERMSLVAVIANHPDVRELLLILNEGFVTTLIPGEDTLIYAGFSKEEAQSVTSCFEKYCNEHKDEIEALRILWNNDGSPISYKMLKDLELELKTENRKFTSSCLWNSYAILKPDAVRPNSNRDEQASLTNIIQLVRFAYHQIEKLTNVHITAQQYFNLWCGQRNNEKSPAQIEVMRQVVNYVASNGAVTVDDIRQYETSLGAQLVKSFGGRAQAADALVSLYKFIVIKKTA